LPPDDFLAQLQLGLAHSAFARQQWNDLVPNNSANF
jgi:hypothetical protein